MMSDPLNKRGRCTPFYAAPRRKTSAEIISEARAAIFGETSGSGSGSRTGPLRPLPTRRPFTPREPQRTLFSDRNKKKDGRPPSVFKITEDENERSGYATDSQSLQRHPVKSTQSSPENWSGSTKLPHLNVKSKPIHRRHTLDSDDLTKPSASGQMVMAIQPLSTNSQSSHGDGIEVTKESAQVRIRGRTKSISSDLQREETIGDVPVKHLSVQMPSTANSSKTNNNNNNDTTKQLTILEITETLSNKHDAKTMSCLLETLQSQIESNQPRIHLRELLIKALFNHIENEDVTVLAGLARVLLTLQVTGAHLLNTCKLVFKIARNDKNDHLFKTSNLIELIIESMGRIDPLIESECVVYSAGAIRLLAQEGQIRQMAIQAGALHILALHFKIFNTAKLEHPRSSNEAWSHALYQITGGLRNLLGNGDEAKEFFASGALNELIVALTLYLADREVLTNVVRCLSVISSASSCASWLSSSASVCALVRASVACVCQQALLVRLLYATGNVAAQHPQAANAIFNVDGSMDMLLTVLETYTKNKERLTIANDPDTLISSDLSGSDGSNQDVLIKCVRVIANLCLSEQAGRGIVESYYERTVKALLKCLQLAENDYRDTSAVRDLEEDDSITCEKREELATAVLATLNNVTFFKEPPECGDSYQELLEDVCKATCIWLKRPGNASCEAVRALGNLSRSPHIAQIIVINGYLDALADLLEHQDISIRCATAGVIVNCCGAGLSDSTPIALAGLRMCATNKDPECATLLLRALWNAHSIQPLTQAQAVQAQLALHMFIDDEAGFLGCESSRGNERRASNPELSKVSNLNIIPKRSLSMEQDLYSSDEGLSGEDQGFEDGEYSCECELCKRAHGWDEMMSIAGPLMGKIRTSKSDVAVGTD